MDNWLTVVRYRLEMPRPFYCMHVSGQKSNPLEKEMSSVPFGDDARGEDCGDASTKLATLVGVMRGRITNALVAAFSASAFTQSNKSRVACGRKSKLNTVRNLSNDHDWVPKISYR